MPTYLGEDPDDLSWLQEVHGVATKGYHGAILYGNEDSPTKVEVYARDDYRCPPDIWEPGDDGKMKRTIQGEQPVA